jgi:hypothetical protein
MGSVFLEAIQSFWDIFKSFVLYQQMVFRLVWRGGLSAEFAPVMAIKGQIRRDEAHCLYELAQEASGEGVIVEIGSYCGLSTIALAKGSSRNRGVPVFAIDPHEYVDPGGSVGRGGWDYVPGDNIAFFKNVLFSGMAKNVRPINLLSWAAAAAWDRPISLLWIDGNHGYEAARRDFVDWSKFVIQGGYIAFHDSIDPADGPFQVVQEALQEGSFEFLRRAEKVTVLCKRRLSSGTEMPKRRSIERTG